MTMQHLNEQFVEPKRLLLSKCDRLKERTQFLLDKVKHFFPFKHYRCSRKTYAY